MTMFSRTWAVPYVLARQELETTLREHGFSLAAEALLPEAANSAWAEYRKQGARIRLEWNGANHWLRLQASTAGAQPALHQWEDIEVLLRDVPRVAMLTDTSLGHARVTVLHTVLRRYLNRA